MPFDISQSFRSNAPAPATAWKAFPTYNFVGGNIDGDTVPAGPLADAVLAALKAEGNTLATYGMTSGPQGYLPFREAIADMLQRRTQMATTPDQVLVTSGSLQAMDLVNALFLEPGDIVIVEQACYGGALTRIRGMGADYVGVELDDDGMIPAKLEAALGACKAAGQRVKYLYLIPTVQNPTASVMSVERRREILSIAKARDLAIFEDDCYADLIFEGGRPPAFRALDEDGRVVYCGSFSKSIAPALRVGYLVADWKVMSRILPLKNDAGSGAIEQMALAGYIPEAFDAHVDELNVMLKAKADVLVEALEANFGEAAEFPKPEAGIFLWVTLPKEVDTSKLFKAAGAEGIAINPGREWATDDTYGANRMRLCFANTSYQEIREGVAKLAEICQREFGVPLRRANVAG
jgi:2-aminoadipate transaminase